MHKGTGIVVSRSGLVITNNHVIRGAPSVRAADVGNGKTYAATVLGYSVGSEAPGRIIDLAQRVPKEKVVLAWIDEFGHTAYATVRLTSGPPE